MTFIDSTTVYYEAKGWSEVIVILYFFHWIKVGDPFLVRSETSTKTVITTFSYFNTWLITSRTSQYRSKVAYLPVHTHITTCTCHKAVVRVQTLLEMFDPLPKVTPMIHKHDKTKSVKKIEKNAAFLITTIYTTKSSTVCQSCPSGAHIGEIQRVLTNVHMNLSSLTLLENGSKICIASSGSWRSVPLRASLNPGRVCLQPAGRGCVGTRPPWVPCSGLEILINFHVTRFLPWSNENLILA